MKYKRNFALVWGKKIHDHVYSLIFYLLPVLKVYSEVLSQTSSCL